MDVNAVLPIVSLIAVCGACLVAIISWRSRDRGVEDRVTAWDVSGALALIGIAASVFGEPDYVVKLFERSPR